MNTRLVIFELNEVPYSVIDDYAERNPQSHWATMLRRAARFKVRNPDREQLHPKISWQTFHRGVADHVHGFREYNQIDAPGHVETTNIWDRLRYQGFSVGVGASIGAWPVPDDRENIAFYLPDPFAPQPTAIPEKLSAFQQLNTRAVAHSGRNVRTGGFSIRDASRLAFNLARLGITAATIRETLQQLLGERRDRKRIVRRRNIQARMSFDVVLHQIRQKRPDFSTLFGNHVAAAMHRYWAAAYPNDYLENRMPAEWRADYRDEIDVAMKHADHMLGQLLALSEQQPDLKILLLGSMGQAAIEHEVTYNQLVIRDMHAFMRALGFEPDDYRVLNGMEPEYVIDCASKEIAERFRQVLGEQISIAGEAADVKPSNATQTAFLVFLTNTDIDHILIRGQRHSLDEVGMHIEPIQDLAGSTAQHVPEGSCLVFDAHDDLSRFSDADEYELTGVTSSILSHFGAAVNEPLTAPIDSLLNALAGHYRVQTEQHGEAAKNRRPRRQPARRHRSADTAIS